MLNRKTFSTFTLLSFTCFSSAIYAGQSADFLNGIIREGEDFQTAQKRVAASLTTKHRKYELTRTQILSEYANDLSSRDTQVRDEALRIAQQICPVLEAKKNSIRRKLELVIEREAPIQQQAAAITTAVQPPETNDDSLPLENIITTQEEVREEIMAPKHVFGFHGQLVAHGQQDAADRYALRRWYYYHNLAKAIEKRNVPSINPGYGLMMDHLATKMSTPLISDCAVISADHKDLPKRNTSVNITLDKWNGMKLSEADVRDRLTKSVQPWIGQPFDYSFEQIGLDDDPTPYAFFKKQADAWLGSIDRKTSPLLKKLGLDIAFFNPDLDPTAFTQLSFVFESEHQSSAELAKKSLAEDSTRRESQLQQMSDELYVIFGRQLRSSEELRKRVDVLSDFFEELKKTPTYQPKLDYKQDAEYCTEMFLSFTQALYGLSHDHKGNSLIPSSSSMMDLSTSVVSANNQLSELCNTLRAEAQKWGHRLMEIERKSLTHDNTGLLKDNGLSAYMFPVVREKIQTQTSRREVKLELTQSLETKTDEFKTDEFKTDEF